VPPTAPRLHPLHLPHGITLGCRCRGPEPARAAQRVMLLHGFPEAAFAWDEVGALLAQARPALSLVAPNLRGYPGSSAPQEMAAYRARHLVEDLAAAVQALGAPLDLLVAHDWGGALAWALAAHRPELLRRLLIVNAPHPGSFLRALRDDPQQQAASAYMNFLCRPDAAALLAEQGWRRLWRFFGDAPAWLTPPRRAAYEKSWALGLEGPLNYYRASPLRPPVAGDDAVLRLELPDAAITVPVPTTVLWGERDAALRPSLLDGLSRWVPRLQVQRVPEGSHWLVHEQPALLAQAVLDALPAA
jgi:pimeloyl-ACP methyl ester carboxylesterase